VGRRDRLERHPRIAALHDGAYRLAPGPLAVAELGTQVLRAELASRRPPWRGVPRSFRPRVRRTSDTLFVLGSGETINDHPAEHWDRVGRHDSVGLNFWLLHQFVASAYLFEWVGREATPEVAARLAVRQELLRLRAHDIGDRPVMFRTPAWRAVGDRRLRPADIEEQLGQAGMNLVVTSDLDFPELDADGFRRATALLRRLHALSPSRTWKYLASTRGSVLWAVIFGVRMGYRSIVLCGVDLTGVTYFFEDPGAPLRVPGAPLPTNTQPGTIHKTADPARPGATMPQLLEAMRDEVLDPIGVSLQVGHPDSALARSFDLYDW